MGNPKQIDSLIRLISMKRRLTDFSLDVHDNLDRTNEVLTNERVLFQQKDYHDNVLASISQLTQSVNHYNTELDALINYLDSSIRKLEIKVIQDNYRNYESFNTTIKERLEIRSQFSSSLNEYIYGLKNSKDNWQFAGLDMWPTDPKFTRETVANDPLYIIANTELAEIVSKEFSEFFANRRLRKYEHLKLLPDNSIGVAYCFGKYENMPIDPIKDEIKILLDKMIPGGIFSFTYNNCEYMPSLEFCNSFRAYQTETMITKLLYSVGFDKIENRVFNDGAHNIMVVQKPGKLYSQKTSPPAIAIVRKHLLPEQTQWIEAHRRKLLNHWISTVTDSASDYPGNFDVDKQRIIEYIQWNIDSVSE